MIPERIKTELSQKLDSAAQAAIEDVSAPGEPPIYQISPSKFVRNFKKLWLLNGREDDTSNRLSGPIYFLFWKNTSVTNLSLNELIALVRSCTHYSGQPDPNHDKLPGLLNFQFSSDAEYSEFLQNMWESFVGEFRGTKLDTQEKARKVCAHITKYYSLVLIHTIVFDYYYTSALVNVPISLSVQLTTLVARSGYIQSAGVGIYVRNIEKAERSTLVSGLNEFLARHENKRFYLIPYAEEFFAKWESGHSASSLRNGLDGVRFHFRKHSIGDLTLQELLALLPSETENRIIVPSGLSEYWKEREAAVAAGADPDTTIWFVSDHNVHETDLPGYYAKGTKQYFVVYAQLISNESQLVLFKERKPAWTAPITLPHTLSTALVNIAHERWELSQRSLGGNPSSPVILDPFCGTGTTLIDVKRRFDCATVIGLDRNPLAATLCRDNLQFFAEPAADLDRFTTHFSDAAYQESDFRKATVAFLRANTAMDLSTAKVSTSPQLLFAFLTQLLLSELWFTEQARRVRDAGVSPMALIQSPFFSRAVKRLLDNGFSADFRRFIVSTLDLHQRRLCFLIWRGIVNGRFAVSRVEDLFVIIEIELKRFCKESRQYLSSLSAASVGVGEEVSLCTSAFSTGAYALPGHFARILAGTKQMTWPQLQPELQSKKLGDGIFIAEVKDSIDAILQMSNCVDLIITDPPYGFNTEEADAPLKELYGRFFQNAVNALKPGGQLIVALPDFARNGRQIPFYQTRTAAIQQVLAHALSEGRRILNYGESVPSATSLFRPPFYWTSTTGVSRSVLHFTVG